MLAAGFLFAGAALSTTSAANAPAIVADGDTISVNAADLKLVADGEDAISFADLAASVEQILADATLHATEATDMGKAVAAVQETLKDMDADETQQEQEDTARDTKLKDALDRITQLEGAATLRDQNDKAAAGANAKAMEELVDSVAEMKALYDSKFNTTDDATATLDVQMQKVLLELGQNSAAVDKLKWPDLRVVHGSWVAGDDRQSAARCPSGQGVTAVRCTVEHGGDAGKSINKGDHTYYADGVKVGPNSCTAFAHVHGGSIRARLECSDAHDTVKVIAQNKYTNGGLLNLDCPSGFRAYSCHCYSAWGNCYNGAFGFTPTQDENGDLTRCSHKSDSNRMLSAICVKAD